MISAEPAERSTAAAPTLKPLVLVVDDSRDARELYVLCLSLAGFRTSTAKNGAEAIEKARAEVPDVIAMDMSLPVMDGWQATSVLKTDPRTREICIIALTGHAEPAYVQRAKDIGCDAFLPKPCSAATLAEEVMACIERRRLPCPLRRQPACRA